MTDDAGIDAALSLLADALATDLMPSAVDPVAVLAFDNALAAVPPATMLASMTFIAKRLLEAIARETDQEALDVLDGIRRQWRHED